MNKPLHVHFMGIGGSGMSAVAKLAQAEGYKVSGCDLQETNQYLLQQDPNQLQVYKGHDVAHLDSVDILAVTPATFFQAQGVEEFKEAKKRGILMKWQEFLGKYLQKEKTVISVAGTHGKSTTTALLSLVFQEAGLDPNVMIGATIRSWGKNYRSGKGEYFITESDEFSDNYLSYYPEIIILNNIEFDHPDYFSSWEQYLDSFKKFISNLKGKKILIFNQDSEGIKELFTRFSKDELAKLNLYGYTLFDSPLVPCVNSTKAVITNSGINSLKFKLQNPRLALDHEFLSVLPGDYNVSNACGVVIASTLSGITTTVLDKVLSTYSGIGRRLELVGETKNNITIYDDYGHHPSAIKLTVHAIRQKHPEAKIWAVIEPHSFSRTKALLHLYKEALIEVDEVVITPIYKSRDSEDFGVSSQTIIDASGHKSARVMEYDLIPAFLKNQVEANSIIVVFGAGKIFYMAKEIFSIINNE